MQPGCRVSGSGFVARCFVTEALEAARGAACAEPCGAAGTPARSGPACAPCTAGGSSGCGGREVSAFPRAAAGPAPAALRGAGMLGWVVTPHPVRCSHVPNKTRFFLGPTCIRTVSRVPVTPTSSVTAVVLEVKAGRKNSSVWTSRRLLYILHPPMVSRIFLCSHF